MKKISDRLNPIAPSATMAMTQRADELKDGGVDVVSFSAGEPDFDTPAHIIEAAKRALDDGFTRYTPATGTMDLKEAVAARSGEVRKVPCTADQVIIGVGAKHALYNFFMAVLDQGDEVVIPAPFWVSYPDQVRLAGGKPVFAGTSEDEGWILTGEELARHVTPKTKAVVLNSPSNPSGALYSGKAMADVVATALELGLYVVSDEVYRDLVYDGGEFASALGSATSDRDKVFTVDGVSKTYAMTGWRIGWGIGDPEIVSAMGKIQGQSTSNPTSISQAAALEALRKPADFLVEWKAQYQRRRDAIVEGLNRIDGISCSVPMGAFYVLPNVRKLVERLGSGKTDVDFSDWLLGEARVATVPGLPFGAPGHIRLSYATSLEIIREGLSRMAEAIDKL